MSERKRGRGRGRERGTGEEKIVLVYYSTYSKFSSEGAALLYSTTLLGMSISAFTSDEKSFLCNDLVFNIFRSAKMYSDIICDSASLTKYSLHYMS